jgi:hypothetical protein
MHEPPRQDRPYNPGQPGQQSQPGQPGQYGPGGQPYPGRQPYPGQQPGRQGYPGQPGRPGQQNPYPGQPYNPGRQPYPPQGGQPLRQAPQEQPDLKQALPKRPRRQRHWPYMLMLVVLLPLIVAFEYWVEAKDNVLNGEYAKPAAVVAKGATGTYQGATWKLTKMEIDAAPKEIMAKLPRGTRLVMATFEVTPRTAKDSKAIQYCKFQAVDDQPRLWDALAADSCERKKGEYETVPIPAGQTQKVMAAFVVPKDAATKIRAQVKVGMEGGALEFAR